MRNFFVVAMAVVATAGTMLAFEGDARACGGCFHPPPGPTENPSMVTEHRMILSVSSKQTTLYDQIKYTGSPKDFAWVLPINGAAKVGLSADVVFTALGSLTETRVNAPPMNCPAPPSGCLSYGEGDFAGAPSAGGSSSSGSGGAGSAADAGVTVTHQEQVGPYETVQLHATDPAALSTWLADHGYVIPSDVTPVITAYQQERYDFLALKLAPGAGVSAMRPVRVTTPGGSPVLPLRMVAAGTGATVGITLWVLAEGRYEPQNFPSFAIGASDLVWDWKTGSSNFAKLRADKEAATQNRAWETESSTDIAASQITTTIQQGARSSSGGVDYLGIDASAAGPGETPTQVEQDDIDTLFAGLNVAGQNGGTIRVTRLRSDLAHAALASDLILQASADQSALPLARQVTKEANEPVCPIFQGCDLVGQGPRSQAQAAAANNAANHKESFSCSASARTPASTVVYSGLLGLAALSFVRSRRRARPSSRKA